MAGTTAIARFDHIIPVRTSTLSDWIILSASCTAISGLRWSSLVITEIFLLPLTASINPSLTSIPKPDPPPERVVIMPTFTLCPSANTDEADIITNAASVVVKFFILNPLNSLKESKNT